MGVPTLTKDAMFSDPLTLTLASTSKSFNRTNVSGASSAYTESSTGAYQLLITHFVGKRQRDQLRLNWSKVVSDPYATGRSFPVSASAFVTLDTPLLGFSNAEKTDMLFGLCDSITRSTGSLNSGLISQQI